MHLINLMFGLNGTWSLMYVAQISDQDQEGINRLESSAGSPRRSRCHQSLKVSAATDTTQEDRPALDLYVTLKCFMVQSV